jgi:hypothetical protein
MVDVVDGRERVSGIDLIAPEPKERGRGRQRAEAERPPRIAAAEEEQQSDQRNVQPAVVADQPGRTEEERSGGGAVEKRAVDRGEQEREERRLARAGRAGLDVQGREREPQRREEGRLGSAQPLGNAPEEPDGQKPGDERHQPRREHAIAQEPDGAAQKRQVQRAELVRLVEAAPQMGRPRPALGDLDAHRRISVVLHSKQ